MQPPKSLTFNPGDLRVAMFCCFFQELTVSWWIFLFWAAQVGLWLFCRKSGFPGADREWLEPKNGGLEFGNLNYLHGTQMNSKITLPKTNS